MKKNSKKEVVAETGKWVQSRTPDGKFGKKVWIADVVVPAPAKPKRVSKKKVTASKPITQFNVVVLDESSSMNSVKNEVIQGYNKLVEDSINTAKNANIPTFFCTVLFASYVRDISITPNYPTLLDNRTYRPMGSTALYDAICRGVESVDNYIKSKNIENVVVNFTIITDGQENSSKNNLTYTRELIEQKKKENWMISFVGAGRKEAVMLVGQSFNINKGNVANFRAGNKESTRSIFAKMSTSSMNYTENVAKGIISTDGYFQEL